MTNRRSVPCLPTELLQCITDELPNHDLPTVRLVCRSFEKAAFKRFVDENFTIRRCWIYDATRWATFQEILSSPCLGRKVRKVAFVARVMDAQAIEEIHTAPNENRDDIQVAQHGVVADLTWDMLASSQPPGSADILPVMERLAELKISILVDLFQVWKVPSHCGSVERNLFAALCHTQNRLVHLAIDNGGIESLGEILTSHEAEMLTIAKGIEELVYEPCDGDYEGGTVRDHAIKVKRLIAGATHLRDFTLRMWGVMDDSDPANNLAHGLLLANPFSMLQSLTLEYLWLEAPALLQALGRCRAPLRGLRLFVVAVTKRHGNEWRQILQFLTTMPRLKYLVLTELRLTEDWLVEESLNFGRLARPDGDGIPTACFFVHQFINEGIRMLLERGLVFEKSQYIL